MLLASRARSPPRRRYGGRRPGRPKAPRRLDLARAQVEPEPAVQLRVQRQHHLGVAGAVAHGARALREASAWRQSARVGGSATGSSAIFSSRRLAIAAAALPRGLLLLDVVGQVFAGAVSSSSSGGKTRTDAATSHDRLRHAAMKRAPPSSASPIRTTSRPARIRAGARERFRRRDRQGGGDPRRSRRPRHQGVERVGVALALGHHDAVGGARLEPLGAVQLQRQAEILEFGIGLGAELARLEGLGAGKEATVTVADLPQPQRLLPAVPEC